jgi:hypothetical protein
MPTFSLMFYEKTAWHGFSGLVDICAAGGSDHGTSGLVEASAVEV